jgi:16S rRNA (guanine966-N2)-methyltransferase
MRIISGKYKGRAFNNKLPSGIRPTQDAMRETIFNILNNHIDMDGVYVADVCAGAGMLGLEAMSRGATSVSFVDKNRKALDYIQSSLQQINADSSGYKLHNLDALQFIGYYAAQVNANVSQPLDLLFLDPPYSTNIVNDVLVMLGENNILHSDGIAIVETAIHYAVYVPDNCEIITERHFGAAKVTFLSAK